MVRDDDDRSESLEVIDLAPEIGAPTRRPRQPTRSRARVALVGVAAGAVATLLVATSIGAGSHRRARAVAPRRPEPVSSTPTRTTGPIVRPRGPIVGRYYPAVDRTDHTALILPSGRTLTVSGNLKTLIGGLGAIFGGAVITHTQTCCADSPLTFEIFHAPPSSLFDVAATNAISIPLLLLPAQAKPGADGLEGAEYRLGILSAGGWTLVAFFLNYESVVATLLLHGWRLDPTARGAVLDVPTSNRISSEYVTLGRIPDLTDREIMLAEQTCPASATKARTLEQTPSNATWCDHGLLVTIDGPERYVKTSVAGLNVSAPANPPAASR